MSDIKNYIGEINEIEKELKRLQGMSKKLRDRKNALEKKVEKYMEDTKRTGFKCGSSAVVMENIKRRKTKGKKQKHDDINKLLKSAGIYNEILVKKIIDETHGEVVEKNRVKVLRK